MEYQGMKRDTVGGFFGTMTARDEKVQPIAPDAGFEWTETSMYGFNIPEHNIDCLIHMWLHPRNGVATNGVVIWQGDKPTHMDADALDFRAIMPLPDDITDCTYANGLTVKMIEPMKRYHLDFRHQLEDTHFSLDLEAVMPPAVRYTNNHFTQAMRTRGELVLKGKPYRIDGYHSRDRSWREHRTERPQDLPPLAWMVGVFGDDLAFHCAAFDRPEHHPDWVGVYPGLATGKTTLWGYVWDKGTTHPVVDSDLHVRRRADGLAPDTIALTLYTDTGASYVIEGRVTAQMPMPGWFNMYVYFGLTEWRCNGRVGHGDIQDVTQALHMRRFRKGS